MESFFSLLFSFLPPADGADIPVMWDSTPEGWEIYMERSASPGCFLWHKAGNDGFLRFQISRPDNTLYIYFGSQQLDVVEKDRYPLDMDFHRAPVWEMTTAGFFMDTIPTLGTAVYDADAASFLEDLSASRTLSLRSGAVSLGEVALGDVARAVDALESCQGVLDMDKGYSINRFRSLML